MNFDRRQPAVMYGRTQTHVKSQFSARTIMLQFTLND